jgi:signal transduction histidine kinase
VLAPVCLLGECWGAVQALRDPSDPFAPEDEARLARFADLVAQAVANAEARAALAASRQRIVEAADSERRRLERNLHDGAQQRLVSVALLLRVAENRVNAGEEGAAPLLRSAAEECAMALEELRELARGIHPAVLSEHGLGPALAGLAGRCPVPVELDVELAERLPGGVEASAYYVVSEALANVTKYAQATEVIVRATCDDGVLVVEVEDDGIGGADSDKGTGLRGLADRVEALSGRLSVASAPGEGTLVRAELPVQRP